MSDRGDQQAARQALLRRPSITSAAVTLPKPWTGGGDSSPGQASQFSDDDSLNGASEGADRVDETGGQNARSSELASLRRDASAEGFEQGRHDGAAAARAEFEAGLQRLGELLESVRHQRDDMLSALEDDIVALSLEAVTMLIGEHANDRQRLQAYVERIVATHIANQPIAVRVAPEDAAILNESLRRLPEEEVSALRVTADPTIVAGGCVLQMEAEQLDYRLDLQLQKLRQGFLDVRAAAGAVGTVGSEKRLDEASAE